MHKYRNSNFLIDLYYRRKEFELSLAKARKSGYSVFVNRVRRLNNCLNARKEKGDISIQDIFHEHRSEFLEINKDKEIYQRDIEKQFSIGRSTVTAIIQLMEKRDLVRRESVEHDARLKKVILTEKGYEHHDLVEENIYNIHKKVMAGISEEEKELFLSIARKMESNLKMVKTDNRASVSATDMDLKEE